MTYGRARVPHSRAGGRLKCMTQGTRSFLIDDISNNCGSRNGAVARVLASQQGVLGSIPGPGVICGLSLLLVLFLALRGFSLGTPVLPSPQKPKFPNSTSIWIIVKLFIM